MFAHSWALVADGASIAQVGDQLGVAVGSAPIVIVHTEAGLRAFHNVCRHRGSTVVDGCAHAASMRCAYHGWEWDLSGALIRVPQRSSQFPDLDPTHLGLHPAAVAEWNGMVFVNPDPAAQPFASALAGLGEHLGSFRPSELCEVARARIELACNWKLFVENHIDVYHLWYLHDRSLADFEHTSFEHHQLGDNWASYEPMRAEPAAQASAMAGRIRHLNQRDGAGIQAHMLFPNTLMAASTTYFATYAVHPLSPTSSWIDLRIRAEATADADELLAITRAFIDEDVRACEHVQAALGSSRFAVGPLAAVHEHPITTFQANLLARVGEMALVPAPTP